MIPSLFFSTYALIFTAELPGKTAFASLFLATRKRPWAVFLGAAAAFVVQSTIAVSFGRLLSLLPPRPVRVGAGLLFLIFAFVFWRQRDAAEEASSAGSAESEEPFFTSFMEVFWVIFVAEWGDLTQLGTAALAAQHKDPLTIFVSATLALWSVAAIAVFAGNRAKHLFKARVLNMIAAAAFTIVGLAMLAS